MERSMSSLIDRDDVPLTFDDTGADDLIEALAATPLSHSLKRLLVAELFDSPLLNKSPAGVTYFPGAAAFETSEVRVISKLGRAGIAFVAAFRALSTAASDEICGGSHAVAVPEVKANDRDSAIPESKENRYCRTERSEHG
jgi:hypothetical protein